MRRRDPGFDHSTVSQIKSTVVCSIRAQFPARADDLIASFLPFPCLIICWVSGFIIIIVVIIKGSVPIDPG